MKRNLITKVIAGGFFTIAAFVSYAATVTTTSDYFTVDTREQFTVAPTSANWSEGSITLTCTGGTINCTLEYSKSPLLNDWQLTDGATMSQDADGNILFTDKKFATRLDGVLPVYYRVKNPDSERTTEPCITRVRHGLAIGLGKYDSAFTSIGEDGKPVKLSLEGHEYHLRDVDLLAEIMTKHGGGISESNMKVLKNSAAKVSDISREWASCADKTRPGDVVFFYIGTHGGTVSGGALAAYDKVYTRAAFQNDIKPFRVGDRTSVKVALIIMACHSATMTEDYVGYDYGGLCTPNMVYISASEASEVATTFEGISKTHSTFGEFLLNQGIKNYQADEQHTLKNISGVIGNKDGRVDLLECARYASKLVIGVSDKWPQNIHYDSDNKKSALMASTIVVSGQRKSAITAPRPPEITAKLTKEGVKLSWRLVSGNLYYIISYTNVITRETHWILATDLDHWGVYLLGTPLIIKTAENITSDDKYTPLEVGGVYRFSIVAVNAGGRSDPSNVIEVKVPASRQVTPSTPSDSAGESLTFSQTYTFTSYLQLPDDGGAAGTMTVKTQKEKGGVAAATVTIQPVGGKKQTIKGKISTADGTGQGALAGLTFTASGVTGTLKGFSVDGAIDASKSKDAATVALLKKFKGKSYVMALEPDAATGENAAMVNGIAGFSIVFSAKGKAKVTGTMPDGTKVSVSSQLIVGSEWCCLPVVYSKTGNSLAFLLWFDREGNFDSVSGMTAWKGKGFEVTWNEDVAMSANKSLNGVSYFYMEDAPTEINGTVIIQELLPLKEQITPVKTRWNVVKADRVKLDRYGNLSYGSNPSGLKLTYDAKTGIFKGAFKLYTIQSGSTKANSDLLELIYEMMYEESDMTQEFSNLLPEWHDNGVQMKLKAYTISVNGVVVDGVGYGTATCKKPAVSWPVRVK